MPLHPVLCFILALAISSIIGVILLKTDCLGLGQAIYNWGCLPTIIIKLLELVLIIFIFIWTYRFIYKIAKAEYDDVYYTTKVELKYYNKREKEPYGKEAGKLPVDTVLKVKYIRHKKEITWLDVFVLDKGSAKKIYVIIPDKINAREETKYYFYNATSKSFNAYCKKIDNDNKNTELKIRDEFLQELKNNEIFVKSSSDNILKESIKKETYFLSENGYFGGAYKVSQNEFYYIPKKQKKTFKKIVSKYKNKLSDEWKQYYKD